MSDPDSTLSKYGLLLGGFLLILDVWRSFASPMQHPALTTKSSNSRNRRDGLYLASVVFSVFVFILVSHLNHTFLSFLLIGIALYRVTDILLALARIAVVGAFGAIPAYQLSRAKVMRNTLAVLMNYFELVFWYGAVYFFLAIHHPNDFFSPGSITPALALILSFTTLTTIGYGNIAPQGFTAALLCLMQALTAIVTLSCVIGSLVSLISSSNKPETPEAQDSFDQDELLREPPWLPCGSATWFTQRILVVLAFVALAFALIHI